MLPWPPLCQHDSENANSSWALMTPFDFSLTSNLIWVVSNFEQLTTTQFAQPTAPPFEDLERCGSRWSWERDLTERRLTTTNGERWGSSLPCTWCDDGYLTTLIFIESLIFYFLWSIFRPLTHKMLYILTFFYNSNIYLLIYLG